MKPLTMSLVLLLAHGLSPSNAQEKKDKVPLNKDEEPHLKIEGVPEIPEAAPDNAPKVLGKYLKPGKGEIGVVVSSPIGKFDWQQLTPDEEVGAGQTYVVFPGCRADVQLKNVTISMCGNLPEILPVPTVIESALDLHQPKGELAVDVTLRTGRIILTSQAERSIVRLRLENPKLAWTQREIVDLAIVGNGAQVLIDRGGKFRPRDFFKDPKDPRRDGPGAFVGIWVMKGSAVLRHATDTYSLTAPPGRASLIWSTQRGLDQSEPIKELPAIISFQPPMPDLTDAAQRKLRDSILKAVRALAREPAGKPIGIRLGLASEAADVGRRILAIRCLAAIGRVPFLLDRLAEERDKDVWLEVVKSIRHYITVSRDNEYLLFDVLKKRHTEGESVRIMELLDGLHNTDALVDFLDNPHLTIRQLAHLNLCEVEPAGKGIPYDARIMNENQRMAAQQAWMKVLHKK